MSKLSQWLQRLNDKCMEQSQRMKENYMLNSIQDLRRQVSKYFSFVSQNSSYPLVVTYYDVIVCKQAVDEHVV